MCDGTLLGICGLLKAPGDTCEEDSECLSGSCLRRGDTGYCLEVVIL